MPLLSALLLAGVPQVWGAHLRNGSPLLDESNFSVFGEKNKDALHFDNVSNISDRWSFWEKPPGGKKMLLAVVGSFKSFGQFWEKTYRNFVLPQRKAGWEVYILHNFPYSQINCSLKHEKMPVHKAEWCRNYQLAWGNGRQIHKGPSYTAGHMIGAADDHFHWIDTVDVCQQKEGEEAPGLHSTTDYLGGPWRSVGCGGMMHFASRGTQVMDRFRNRVGWDKVVLLRGDNSFSMRHRPKDLSAPILIEKACGKRGGVKIIGPERQEGMFGGDFDQAWILCEGSLAGAFRRAVASMGLECDESCTEETRPPCPAGMDLCKEGERLPCNHQLCATASVLAKANTTFSMVNPSLGYVTTSHRQSVVIRGTATYRKDMFFLIRSPEMKELASGVEPEDNISKPMVMF